MHVGIGKTVSHFEGTWSGYAGNNISKYLEDIISCDGKIPKMSNRISKGMGIITNVLNFLRDNLFWITLTEIALLERLHVHKWNNLRDMA